MNLNDVESMGVSENGVIPHEIDPLELGKMPIFWAKAIPGLVNIEKVIQAMATEIVDLPIKRRCFPLVMLVYQRVYFMV